ncbi:hypothetical protein NC651_006499 [Populus alba x Populus x berolinensis]|nr:hypothetical protein NC651_006499 [Populus alba x Populus x berolinensis]
MERTTINARWGASPPRSSLAMENRSAQDGQYQRAGLRRGKREGLYVPFRSSIHQDSGGVC